MHYESAHPYQAQRQDPLGSPEDVEIGNTADTDEEGLVGDEAMPEGADINGEDKPDRAD